MEETKTLDVKKYYTQAVNLHAVSSWVAQVVNNEKRISALEKGIDAEVFNMDKLLQRRETLHRQENIQRYLQLELPELKLKLDQTQSEILLHTNIVFKQDKSNDVRTESANRLETLNTDYKELDALYKERMSQIEPELQRVLPTIYGLVMGGTPLDKLKHVFETFNDMQKGRITVNQAANKGIDYEEEHGAPVGLFDCLLDGPRVKNGKKVRKTQKGELH